MKKLFISPHCDDVEISCGGSLDRFDRECHSITLAVVTGEGDITMAHSSEVIPFSQRKKEQWAAAECLGIDDVRFLNLGPATLLDTIPLSKGVQIFDALFSEGFNEVYIPLPSHAQDHVWVWKACMAATRPTKNDTMSIFLYEQPTQFHGEQLNGSLYSRYYVKLNEYNMQAKVAAINRHKSQMVGREQTLVGAEGALRLARLRGMEIDEEYAEMFHVLRMVI